MRKLLSITLIAILVMATIPALALAAESPRAAEKLKITWDANGGKIGTKKTVTTTVTKGNKIGKLPETPKYTGYAFKGWFTSKTGGTKVTTSTKPTKATTYYAQWSKGEDQQTSNYYTEAVALQYDENFDAPSTIIEYTMGADGKKSATIIQYIKPNTNRMRTIVRDGYSYFIFDTYKYYTKTPLTNNNNNNGNTNNDYESDLVQVGKGTGPVGKGTKYLKTLPYIEYKSKKSDDKTRHYMDGSKIYAYETISKTYINDWIILKSGSTPPQAIFELKIAGYEDKSY